MLDLGAMEREINELHVGKSLDEVTTLEYVQIIGKVREIFNTPGLLDLIHAYVTTRRGGHNA